MVCAGTACAGTACAGTVGAGMACASTACASTAVDTGRPPWAWFDPTHTYLGVREGGTQRASDESECRLAALAARGVADARQGGTERRSNHPPRRSPGPAVSRFEQGSRRSRGCRQSRRRGCRRGCEKVSAAFEENRRETRARTIRDDESRRERSLAVPSPHRCNITRNNHSIDDDDDDDAARGWTQREDSSTFATQRNMRHFPRYFYQLLQ